MLFSEDKTYHNGEIEKELDEYVLNEEGSWYCGSGYWPRGYPWEYGQFQKDILYVSLALVRKANGWKIKSSMSDPVYVARALSKIVSMINLF